MAKESERFVAYGFVKKGVDPVAPVIKVGKFTLKIEGKTPEDKIKLIKKKKEEFEKIKLGKEFEKAIENIANHEWVEVAKDQMVVTDYPNPLSRYYLGLSSWHESIEPYYYWIMNFLEHTGFPVIEKVTDTFTAAEHSSFYGASAQRLGLAQDKVAQYLATIGKMVKDLFQLVRELRWIDERLEIYRDAFGINKEGKPTEKGPQKGAELALKGMWVDLVDGVVQGQRTGSNIFVMAQQLQFTSLPDMFFAVNVDKKENIDKAVEEQAKEFNLQVKNLLKRKLHQYLAWKHSTFDEMKTRRQFTLDYLRQHYNVIRMYMTWVKPYIKHIERLTGQEDLINNPKLIAAFESSLVEIEVVARTRPAGLKEHFACVMITFEYHTKPSMQYPGDSGYHRGPIHVGETRITWRSYAWNDQQIKNYIAMRNKEDMELLASIDSSLKSAMEAMGTDLMSYLEEAEKGKKEEEKPIKKPLGLTEPFGALGKGMTEMLGAIIPKLPGGKPAKESAPEDAAIKMCWVQYNIFKKAHGLLSWG
ncbi:hypothetical protein KY319_03365 [Candidatus Woesearchaeota archaeon]|nr:hypothetical protein [Candidatus Woesearchaeota archaeon]